jgi:hypothetical protein
MAYVVRRPKGRWEIRESVATDKGPRSRTLASFRRFTPAVVSRAVRAASRPTSSAEIYEAARRAGAASSAADAAAQALLAEVARGRPPSPGLRRLVLAMLSDPPAHDPPGAEAAEWFGVPDERRGETLDDLLRFVDAVPPRPRGPLQFPPLRDMTHADA